VLAVDLAEAAALRGPLEVGLDDLQRADPSSLLTLAAMARRLADSPVALLVCLRLRPRSEELVWALDALEAPKARRLALGQLGEEAVAQLVVDALAAQPGGKLLAQVAAAGGNPLFITELLAALDHEGAIQTVNGRAEVAEATCRSLLDRTSDRSLEGPARLLLGGSWPRRDGCAARSGSWSGCGGSRRSTTRCGPPP
jgi:predicted ATPase